MEIRLYSFGNHWLNHQTNLCRLNYTFLIFMLKDIFVPLKKPTTSHIYPFCRMSISTAEYIFPVAQCFKIPIILGKGFPLLSSVMIWKYFLSTSLIFSALNQFHQPERNVDTQCKDEGISKRLKNHTGESQVSEEREEKEGDQKQKEKEAEVHVH